MTGGSGDESDPDFTYLVVELIGNTDVTGAAFPGNHYIITGKWIEANQNHTVGDKNIYMLYDDYDAGCDIGINIGNTDNSTDSAIVIYQALDAETNVTINGLGGISFTEDGKVCVGEQLTIWYSEGAFSPAYAEAVRIPGRCVGSDYRLCRRYLDRRRELPARSHNRLNRAIQRAAVRNRYRHKHDLQRRVENQRKQRRMRRFNRKRALRSLNDES